METRETPFETGATDDPAEEADVADDPGAPDAHAGEQRHGRGDEDDDGRGAGPTVT